MTPLKVGLIVMAAGSVAFVMGNKPVQTPKQKNIQKIGFVSILLGAGLVLLASRKTIAA